MPSLSLPPFNPLLQPLFQLVRTHNRDERMCLFWLLFVSCVITVSLFVSLIFVALVSGNFFPATLTVFLFIYHVCTCNRQLIPIWEPWLTEGSNAILLLTCGSGSWEWQLGRKDQRQSWNREMESVVLPWGKQLLGKQSESHQMLKEQNWSLCVYFCIHMLL